MPAFPSNLVAYKKVVGADPAANNEFTLTVPVGKWWYVYSVYVLLVQGITQTPQPILQFDDGTTVFLESIGSSAAQAVSTTCAYTWGPGFVQSGQVGTGAGVHSVAPLPADLLLPAGFRIKSSTLGLGANSDYGVPAVFLAELG